MAAISSEEFDVFTNTAGLLSAPCRLVAYLELKRPDGSGCFTNVTIAGWDEHGSPVVLLPNGHLGGLTMGMTIHDVSAY